MNKNEQIVSKVRKIYRDILLGYTKPTNTNLYIKHFRELDIGELNEVKQEIKDSAQKKGLLSEKEKIDILIDQGVWTKEQEQEIEFVSINIANQYQTKTKLLIKSQIDTVNQRIENLEKELQEKLEKRNKILGLTLESYADRMSSEQIIRLSFYKDKKISELLFSDEEYSDLEPKELNIYLEYYSEFNRLFNVKNLKRIAASSFFLNPLFLCKNNPSIFFGKPIVELTNYQVDLFSYGLSFKAVLEKGETPSNELYSDLDALIDWYESAQKGEKLSTKEIKDGSTVMGANKHELDGLRSGKENVIDLQKEAQKKGGELNMMDFIELHEGNDGK